jgi:hypothetical protein
MHLGGSIPANSTANNIMLDSIGRTGSKVPIPGVESVRDGGIHGIGAGKYMDPSVTSGSNADSLASMCERRLAFELSSLPRPDDAILTLVTK